MNSIFGESLASGVVAFLVAFLVFYLCVLFVRWVFDIGTIIKNQNKLIQQEEQNNTYLKTLVQIQIRFAKQSGVPDEAIDEMLKENFKS